MEQIEGTLHIFIWVYQIDMFRRIRRRCPVLYRLTSIIWMLVTRIFVYSVFFYYGYYKASQKAFLDFSQTAKVQTISKPLPCPTLPEGVCPISKELQFPPPLQCRQAHTCNYYKIPFVHSELASAKILLHSNNSFVRFGDLDIDLMQGISWPNQEASPELSQSLLTVLHNDLPNLFIGIYDGFSFQSRTPYWHQDWMLDHDQYRKFLLDHVSLDRDYLSTIMTSPFVLNRNTSCIPVKLIYDTLRDIWRGKDVVILRGANGQVYEHDVFDTAKTQKIIYAPGYQAWTAYEVLKQQLLAENPNSLYLLSAGPVAKVLTFDLAKAGRRAIDLGHLAKDYNQYISDKAFEGNFFVD